MPRAHARVPTELKKNIASHRCVRLGCLCSLPLHSVLKRSGAERLQRNLNLPLAEASRPALASTTLSSAPEQSSGVPMLACLQGSRFEASTELNCLWGFRLNLSLTELPPNGDLGL